MFYQLDRQSEMEKGLDNAVTEIETYFIASPKYGT
jgi:hypothetical protein